MTANAQQTIDLIFNGVDKTGAAVQSVLGNTNSFASGIQSTTQPIADFTASAVKFEAALLAAGAAFTAFAINEAAGFESALADLNKVLDDTDSLENYADLARDLGKEYGVAIEEVVQSIANYKQAGFTAEEAGILTRSGLDLVIAGGVEASQAADQVVASLKGFGAEAATVVPFVDLLNQVSNEYAVSVDQLLEGFSTFSPIAKSAGLSLQETVGILTPGIEVFRSGSEVANALRTAFLRLQDDSKPVQEALAAIGVSQKNSNGELRSGRDIFFDVAGALREVDDNQRAYLASQLVGIQRSSQFLATIDGLDKSLRIAGDGFEFLGSAAKEVDIQLATAERAAARVGVSFNDLLIGIGTPLLDEFGSVADGISAIFDALGANLNQGGLADVTSLIEDSLGGLSEALQQVAANLPAAIQQADFSGFTDGLRAIGEAFDFVLGDVNLSTVEGLTRAIELLGAGFEGLSLFSAGVIESFKPLFDLLGDLSEGVNGASDAFKDLGNIGGFASQINLAAGAVTSAIPVFEGLLGIIALNQGASLLSSIKALTTSIAGTGGFVSALGLLGAAGASGFGLGTLVNEVTELATGESLSSRLADWALGFTDVNQQAENLTKTIGSSANSSASAIAEADSAMADFNGSISQSVDFWGEYGSSSGQVVPILFDIEGAWQAIQSSTNETTEATKKLAEAAEEISLDEKLALIEASTAVTVADLEANADKTVAAFDSIGTSVVATTDSVSDLFGLLGDENISKFDKLGVKDQIDEQNERLDKQSRQQERLIDSQIRENNARADALRNGRAQIEIDGAGLQPHLEAFMFEILESIQVQVNATGGDFLLGINR